MPSTKSCPPGKVRLQNGRCYTKCKPDQIRNPKTMRCVKRSGKIGKGILAGRASSSKERTPVRMTPEDITKIPEFTSYERELLEALDDASGPASRPARPASGPASRPARPASRPAKMVRFKKVASCTEQKTKKYQNRNSPPYPATACCNAGIMTMHGKDGLYKIKRITTKAGKKYCRWVKA